MSRGLGDVYKRQAFAVVPSSPTVYEALPLFLVPKRRGELVLLVLLSDIVFLLMANLSLQNETAAYLARASRIMLWLIYLPCLLIVLRRPNEGEIPAWLEHGISRVAAWRHGTRWSAE